MEVHHPKVPHQSKKWKEHLLEFLMLFLAVTLGFFAENLREHFVDKKMEKEYIESMVKDLKADTASFSRTIRQYTSISKSIDTMLTCLKADDPDASAINRVLSEDFWMYTGFSYNNETVQQLKNSGNFRLVKDRTVVDSILHYDNNINSFVVNQYNDLKSTLLSYKDAEARVLPYSELKNPATNSPLYTLMDSSDFKKVNKHTFITNDKELIATYYNKLFTHEMLCHTFILSLNFAQQRAIRLINFINKQYQLE